MNKKKYDILFIKFMNNRIFYGEYTLKHWIKLMLTSNIVLPDYQRLFVWKEEDVKNFINQIKDEQFVPTLTIGHYVDSEDKRTNLILDGQQRLSSILLAYLGLYPDKEVFKNALNERMANENDDLEEALDEHNLPAEPDEHDEELDNILKWQYPMLLAHGKTKEAIRSNLQPGNYKEVDYGVNADFFEKHYIGFSYLVPKEDHEMQQRYYSTLFRNINRQGVALEQLESRTSLYYLVPNLKNFFKPDFMDDYEVKLSGDIKKLDFVRYLSLLSEYNVNERKADVAKGMNSTKMERYYEDYINAVVLDSANTRFKQFSSIFLDKNYASRMELLKRNIEKVDLPKSSKSIIELDVYFFGIIYISLFKGQEITASAERIENLKRRLQNHVATFKSNVHHKKSPAGIGYLRSRLETSVKLYNTYSV